MAGRIKRMVMLRWCMGILAVLIGTSAHAEKISEITIEGLRRIDKEGVLGIIGSEGWRRAKRRASKQRYRNHLGEKLLSGYSGLPGSYS